VLYNKGVNLSPSTLDDLRENGISTKDISVNQIHTYHKAESSATSGPKEITPCRNDILVMGE
jgi:hypothetical protein